MIYPNKDEVYYTDVVYEINEYSGILQHDEESTELRWFKIDEIPNEIMPEEMEYIKKFIENLKK